MPSDAPVRDPSTEIEIESSETLDNESYTSNWTKNNKLGLSSFSLLCSNSNGKRGKKKRKARRTTLIFRYFVLISSILLISGMPLYFYINFGNDWIHVHLIPHSHDDVGWLRTVDQYYLEDVKGILNNVIYELTLNPSRRFTYVETVFFWRWWLRQNENKRLIVKKLVESGQLEFAGGGWSMNDEAVTNYQCIIDQYTWGLRRLNDTFGEAGRPVAAWQIDAFGHSQEMASIMGQIGFDGVIFARIDEHEREHRLNEKLMEVIWEGSSYLGPGSSILTSIMYKHYNPPKGFHFEKFENEVLNDDKKIDKFITHIKQQAEHYKTNHILIPMGDDFTYLNARVWFDNIEKLIKFIEKKELKINIFYSTPSQYLKSINSLNLTWESKSNDFLPYASNKYSYWTGYYTSRPSLKYLERVSNNVLQVCKQLSSVVHLGFDFLSDLTVLREAMGVVQHHDAITGTAKQHVTNDYVRMLAEGLAGSNRVLDAGLGLLTNLNTTQAWEYCLLLNTSTCRVSEESSSYLVTVYNPLGWYQSKYVRVPVTNGMYSIYSNEDGVVPYQLLSTPQTVINLAQHDNSTTHELLFHVNDVPPVGYKTYHINRQADYYTQHEETDEDVSDDVLTIGNDKLIVVFNKTTGLLTSVTLNNKTTFHVEQQLVYYISVHHWSGAYAFRPSDNERHTFQDVKLKVINRGKRVQEVEQVFSDWASQIVRIYKDEPYVEIEWLTGPVPNSDYFGREVISLFSSRITNNGIFYTDTNGRETIKRVRNYRQDWDAVIAEKVAGNYYPVTSRIFIKDDDYEMHVVNDRAQGGSSVYDGEIELMVHRRLCYDEGYGVGEPLNETEHGVGLIARGKHWLFIAPTNTNAQDDTKLFSINKYSDVLTFFKSTESTGNLTSQFSGLARPLPQYIHLLTLEPWRENVLLVRFENIFEPAKHLKIPYASIQFSLKNLFTTFEIIWVKETTLAANQWLSESSRMVWKSEDNRPGIPQTESGSMNSLSQNMTVDLKPMEIRTFVMGVKYYYV